MGSRALGLQWLWCTSLVASQPVGSSWIMEGTCDSSIGRQILYHWAPREAPIIILCLLPQQWVLSVPCSGLRNSQCSFQASCVKYRNFSLILHACLLGWKHHEGSGHRCPVGNSKFWQVNGASQICAGCELSWSCKTWGEQTTRNWGVTSGRLGGRVSLNCQSGMDKHSHFSPICFSEFRLSLLLVELPRQH